MKYAIDILKRHLKAEKSYFCQHKKAVKDANITEKRIYEISVRLAEERIPQLKEAIKLLNL